jgi:lipid-binding SYLF domain-containing protein
MPIRRLVAATFLLGAVLFGPSLDVQAQVLQPAFAAPPSPEVAIVESATNVLNEIMAVPAQGIPQALLHDAQGIAIVPGLIKGGFVIGVRHGNGVVVLRDDNGNWRAPSFISITGGSIGWQAGIQSTDVVLVFKSKNSVKGFISGKFTIGGDVSAAAGPVGREASAATDATLKAEMYSYSRSRGLFAGASLDGSAITLDNEETAAYYRGTGVLQPDGPPGQPPQLPPSAARLLETIAAYSGPGATNAQPADVVSSNVAPTAPVLTTAPTAPSANQLPADIQTIQLRLADSSRRLAAIVDPNWQKYLALPAEIYGGNRPAAPQSIADAFNRFSKVAADPKYQALVGRPEFQETLGLLKSYRDLQTAAANPALALPPPPN